MKNLQPPWNGHKSTGPISIAGREIRAAVNLTHGLTARRARLLSEDPAEHEKHRQLFLSKFQPRDDFEYHLLIQLADLDWKLLRADTIDNSLLDLEVDKSAATLAATYQLVDWPAVWAHAFRTLSDTSSAQRSLSDHHKRLSAKYFRLFEHFCQVRRQFSTNEEGPVSSQPSTEESLTEK